MSKKRKRTSDDYEIVFVKAFRHYITKQIIRASDFGLEAIPLKIRKKNKTF